MAEKKVNLGFRATEKRQEELKIIAAKRRQSLQTMIEQALELLLREPTASVAQSPPSPADPLREKLFYIQAHGDPETIRKVEEAIEARYLLLISALTDEEIQALERARGKPGVAPRTGAVEKGVERRATGVPKGKQKTA